MHLAAPPPLTADTPPPSSWPQVSPKAFDEDMHFSDGGSPLMAQYLLVVDALNFCFWPGEGGAWGREGQGGTPCPGRPRMGRGKEERPALVDRMHAERMLS